MTEKQLTKRELVEKIAKEQNLNPNKLMRMSVEELKKMDLVVPDSEDDLLGGGVEASPSNDDGKPSDVSDIQEVSTTKPVAEAIPEVEISTQETPSTDEEVETEDADSLPESPNTNGERVLLGYHPVTGNEVYSDEQ